MKVKNIYNSSRESFSAEYRFYDMLQVFASYWFRKHLFYPVLLMTVLNLKVVHCCHSIEMNLLFKVMLLHYFVHLLGHLETVHTRHIDICEHKFVHILGSCVDSLLELFDTFLPTECRIDRHLEMLFKE